MPACRHGAAASSHAAPPFRSDLRPDGPTQVQHHGRDLIDAASPESLHIRNFAGANLCNSIRSILQAPCTWALSTLLVTSPAQYGRPAASPLDSGLLGQVIPFTACLHAVGNRWTCTRQQRIARPATGQPAPNPASHSPAGAFLPSLVCCNPVSRRHALNCALEIGHRAFHERGSHVLRCKM
jgi:hypothetical protein